MSHASYSDDEFLDLLKSVDVREIETREERASNHNQLVADLMDCDDRLTDWEYDFVHSLAVNLGQDKVLTAGQVEHLKILAEKLL